MGPNSRPASGDWTPGQECKGEELGGLLLQLQRQREESERVEAARRTIVEDEECQDGIGVEARRDGDEQVGAIRGAIRDARRKTEEGQGRCSEKLEVLERIVEACPRGSVFEFHKYLMRVKDEEFGDFVCLCAALLSVQCLDHVAMRACEKLRSEFPGGFSVQGVANARAEDLEPLINTCNYYKGKAKKIVSCACTLMRKHKGKVPRTQASLLDLDGVGPKIAHLVLSVGLGNHHQPLSSKPSPQLYT